MAALDSKTVDVLAVIRLHAEAHRSLAGSDAYSEQEAPRLEATLAAVAELIEAAKWVAENEDEPRFIYGAIADLRAALAHCGASA